MSQPTACNKVLLRGEESGAVVSIVEQHLLANRPMSPSVRLALNGSASMPARDLDLRGTASLLSGTAGDGQPAFELPFVVQGQWDDPIILPDTQALMQRSPFVSPLREALGKRGSKDTVRDALERLIPGAIGSPASTQPPER